MGLNNKLLPAVKNFTLHLRIDCATLEVTTRLIWLLKLYFHYILSYT
jgi:hypothetical protein